MSDTATEAECGRDDDRASYKDTHGLSPIRSVCMVRPYLLSPENAAGGPCSRLEQEEVIKRLLVLVVAR